MPTCLRAAVPMYMYNIGLLCMYTNTIIIVVILYYFDYTILLLLCHRGYYYCHYR